MEADQIKEWFKKQLKENKKSANTFHLVLSVTISQAINEGITSPDGVLLDIQENTELLNKAYREVHMGESTE